MLRILGGFVLLMALAAGPVVGQQDVLRWRVNSLLYPKLFGEAGERFAETVRLISGGSFVIVEDDQILRSIADLGRDAAVFAEPAASAAHAGLRELAKQGELTTGDEVVLLVTGTGLKDVDAAVRAAGAPPPTIDPSLPALSAMLTENTP